MDVFCAIDIVFGELRSAGNGRTGNRSSRLCGNLRII